MSEYKSQVNGRARTNLMMEAPQELDFADRAQGEAQVLLVDDHSLQSHGSIGPPVDGAENVAIRPFTDLLEAFVVTYAAYPALRHIIMQPPDRSKQGRGVGSSRWKQEVKASTKHERSKKPEKKVEKMSRAFMEKENSLCTFLSHTKNANKTDSFFAWFFAFLLFFAPPHLLRLFDSPRRGVAARGTFVVVRCSLFAVRRCAESVSCHRTTVTVPRITTPPQQILYANHGSRQRQGPRLAWWRIVICEENGPVAEAIADTAGVAR